MTPSDPQILGCATEKAVELREDSAFMSPVAAIDHENKAWQIQIEISQNVSKGNTFAAETEAKTGMRRARNPLCCMCTIC